MLYLCILVYNIDYFGYFWKHSHLRVTSPLLNIEMANRGGLEEKIPFVFVAHFLFGSAQIRRCVQKHGENITKTQTTTQNHTINNQNLDVHHFIRLVISSSPFSKNYWQGLPNYSRLCLCLPFVFVKSEFTQLDHGENGGGPLGWGPLNNQPHIHLI